jgi:hypothetical protein
MQMCASIFFVAEEVRNKIVPIAQPEGSLSNPMKYSSVIASLPRNLRLEDACDYVAGETLLRRLERAGWLKPTVKEKGMTAYDRQDLDRCIERAKLEGWPK